MSKKLAFDTLITALACLLPESNFEHSFSSVPLNTNDEFYADNPNLFCDVMDHLETKWKEFEKQKEQNERQLLQLQLKILQLKEQSSNKTAANDLRQFSCKGLDDGVHKLISKSNSQPFYTVCEEERMLVLQHYGENKPIHRNLNEARKGFGVLHDDFFIGLEHIYALIWGEKYEALVMLKDAAYETILAFYSEFQMLKEGMNYHINLGQCRGDGCDILGKPQKRKHKKENCEIAKSKWWDFSCDDSLFVKVYLKAR